MSNAAADFRACPSPHSRILPSPARTSCYRLHRKLQERGVRGVDNERLPRVSACEFYKLGHKDWCADRLVMEPNKDTHATFRNRDDRRQRKSPYTRNTGNRTIDYHTHRRRIHVPSHDHHATEPSGDPRTTLCTTVESWGWNVLRCTWWRCVESAQVRCG